MSVLWAPMAPTQDWPSGTLLSRCSVRCLQSSAKVGYQLTLHYCALGDTSRGSERKVFYRRGYLFLAPSHVIDRYAPRTIRAGACSSRLCRYERLHDRPCSTYVWRPPDQKKKRLGGSAKQVKPKLAQHMVARFLPEQPLSTSRKDSELSFQVRSSLLSPRLLWSLLL